MVVLKPKDKNDSIQNIAIGSIYVSPSSKHKTATINHIIDTIHMLRAKFDNSINFLIAGDLNRLKIDRILDSYGCLKQIVTKATRNSAILENIISDLHTLYQAPESLAPLQVDDDKIGKDSDHNMIILAPITITDNRLHAKKSVITRPLTESGWSQFATFITAHDWKEVLDEDDIDKKVDNFHQTLRVNLDKYFPEKTIKVSSLDKKWMNPQLKRLLRQIKREFFENRKSMKWRKLKSKFKRLKKKTV